MNRYAIYCWHGVISFVNADSLDEAFEVVKAGGRTPIKDMTNEIIG